MLRSRFRPALASAACVVACALAAGLLYLPALEGEFAWDDLTLIVSDPSALDDWSDAWGAFVGRGAIGQHQAYYRPVLVASYVADARLSGIEPRAFHRTNLLLHVASTALVWAVLFTILRRRDAASLGALLFATHPIQVQAVALVTGRNDLLLLPPFALALLTHHAWGRATGGRRRLLFALLLVIYATVLWTKETGILLPVVLIAADLLVHGIGWRALSSRVGLLAGLGGVAALYLLTRWALFGEAFFGAAASVPWSDRLRDAIAVLGYYVRHIFVPTGFAATAFYEGMVAPGSREFFQASVLCLVFLGTLGFLVRVRPLMAFAMILFLLGLAPVLGLAPMRLLILEHRTYVPMLGIAILAGAVFALVSGGDAARSVRRGAAAVVATGALIALGLTAYRRIPAYRDDLSLWRFTVAQVPNSAYARYAYGFALARRGREGEAVEHLSRAVVLRPDDQEARLELALALRSTHRNAEAEAQLQELISLAPRNVRAWNTLAALHAESGRREDAIAALRHAAALAPGDPVVLGNLGKLLARSDQISEGIEVYRRLTALQPAEASHWVRLARLLARAGAPEEAALARRRALALGYAGPP